MLKNFTSSITFRFFMIGGLILVMLIPLAMVSDLIEERKNRQQNATSEISQKWGSAQTLMGPILIIPYETVTYQKKIRIIKQNKAWLFPESLKIDGKLTARMKKRGIYQAALYESGFNISGNFKFPDVKKQLTNASRIHFDRAFLTFMVSDTRAVQNNLTLDWNGKKFSFLPGSNLPELQNSGLHAFLEQVQAAVKKNSTINFALSLKLNGSGGLRFLPAGKVSNINLKSDWSSPSFQGAYLPKHNTNKQGFDATWNISYFGRNFPQFLKSVQEAKKYNFSNSTFGVDLLVNLDHYQKVNRSAKYGILFLILTFLGYVLIEIFTKVKIHPVQYLLIGSALIIFYVLFLSLAEHLGFHLSYLLSSIAIISIITFYSLQILNRNRILFLAGMLTGLYSYLYIVLISEDYALLLGSIVLFLLLALTMFLTRKINWYEIQLGHKKTE